MSLVEVVTSDQRKGHGSLVCACADRSNIAVSLAGSGYM